MTDYSADRMTRDDAAALGEKARSYWAQNGALDVGVEVFALHGDDQRTSWGFRLTGMCPDRAVPLLWVPGAARVWAKRVARGRK